MNKALIAQMKAAQEFFNRSTEALTEEDSGHAPAEGVYTAASQIAHVAQTIDWFVEGAFDTGGFDMDFEAHDKEVRAVTSIEAARAWFTRAVDNAVKQLGEKSEEEWSQPLPDGPIMGGQPRSSVFWAITDHTAHHRGALTVYARTRGKTPPNPYMDA